MTSTTNPTALFQHYVQNIFVFPKELKNDIVYCQRALKAHIKVHQMVLDVYRTQLNPDPVQKKRIINELESQIYEINAEQQFLLLRLRRVIDEFYKTLSRKNAVIIPELMNDVISSELVPLVNDQNCLIYPCSVHLRSTEEKLIEKYFEVKSENPDNYFEILDSDEEEQFKIEQAKANVKDKSKLNGETHHKEYGNFQQLSLLKPITQRSLRKEPPLSSGENETFIDASQFLEVMDDTEIGNLRGFKPVPSNTNSTSKKIKLESNDIYPVSIQESNSFVGKEHKDLSVSKNVKISRFNLREALKKAHNNTVSAKTSISNMNRFDATITTTATATTTTLTRSKIETDLLNAKKVEQSSLDTHNTSNGVVPYNVINTIVLNSSSDESTQEQSTTPQNSVSSIQSEIVDTRVKPDEFGQELFLRMFGLFTPEMRLQMQQRRSKRKRRNVQNNERSDFHYGHIEYANKPPMDAPKKPKVFLQSPQAKRKRGRPRKYPSIEKSDEATSRSSSSSSSPDEKRSCNECLKNGGLMESCEICKGFYHQYCHRENDVIDLNMKKDILTKAKLCPACERFQARAKSEAKHYETLRLTAKNLEQQMVIEKSRRKCLKEESENFKTQMTTLFKIVNEIKCNVENNSD